ncbi:GNAT family N-acetyltransferase [Shewanella sp. GXUN23E]|uniref:GNAT family N-acetyltransferase n=1 Tax=Shewanella sp. GXUN23E TaxID=3422498 RepID=UPI003D7CF6D4
MTYEFTTGRLTVIDWRQALQICGESFYRQLLALLTPRVTQALPDCWQGVSAATIESWFAQRAAEGEILTLLSPESHDLVGLLLLFADERADASASAATLHIGYLLGEAFQGKGLAKELLQGLIDHCRALGTVGALVGGVEAANQASRHLLEVCGFGIQSQNREHLFYQLQL